MSLDSYPGTYHLRVSSVLPCHAYLGSFQGSDLSRPASRETIDPIDPWHVLPLTMPHPCIFSAFQGSYELQGNCHEDSEV